jgi:sodium transport system permease protein
MLKEVIRKELLRVFTDKRLVISTIIVPALSIYILYSLMGSLIGGMIDDIDEHQSVVYVNNAPESFTAYYESVAADYNMDLKVAETNIDAYKTAIMDGEVDLFVVFGDDFDEMVRDYETVQVLPEVKTYYNPTEDYSEKARNVFVYALLEGYEKAFLLERFDNLDYLKAFAVDATNTESIIQDEKKADSSMLGMFIPMLLAITLFSGAMGVGMDSIAGEKERGTMATLLLTPVDRKTIALGKVISLGIIAIISALCSFVAILLSLPKMMGSIDEEVMSMGTLAFSPIQYLQLLVMMIALVGIFVGIISLISVRANTVKEAGSYIAPIFMVVMGAAFSTMYTTGEITTMQYAIPVYGNVMAMKQLLEFDLPLEGFILAVVVSFVISGVFVKLITSAFNNEKIMFNA